MIRPYHDIQTVIVEDPIVFDASIHYELIVDIFSFLSFQDLQETLSLVSKKWNKLTEDPLLLKAKIYQEKTFNPKDWNDILPDIQLNELEYTYSFDLLPNEIGKMFKGPCPTYPGKKLGETHIIVWLPKDLTLKKFIDIVKKAFPEEAMDCLLKINKNSKFQTLDSKVSCIAVLTEFMLTNRTAFHLHADKSVLEKFGELITERSEWLLMPKFHLLDSIGIPFAEHQKNVNKFALSNFKSCSLPTLLETIVCLSTIFFKTHRKILTNYGILCKEMADTFPVLAFQTPFGISLREADELSQKYVGCAPIRKFNCIK